MANENDPNKAHLSNGKRGICGPLPIAGDQRVLVSNMAFDSFAFVWRYTSGAAPNPTFTPQTTTALLCTVGVGDAGGHANDNMTGAKTASDSTLYTQGFFHREWDYRIDAILVMPDGAPFASLLTGTNVATTPKNYPTFGDNYADMLIQSVFNSCSMSLTFNGETCTWMLGKPYSHPAGMGLVGSNVVNNGQELPGAYFKLPYSVRAPKYSQSASNIRVTFTRDEAVSVDAAPADIGVYAAELDAATGTVGLAQKFDVYFIGELLCGDAADSTIDASSLSDGELKTLLAEANRRFNTGG